MIAGHGPMKAADCLQELPIMHLIRNRERSSGRPRPQSALFGTYPLKTECGAGRVPKRRDAA